LGVFRKGSQPWSAGGFTARSLNRTEAFDPGDCLLQGGAYHSLIGCTSDQPRQFSAARKDLKPPPQPSADQERVGGEMVVTNDQRPDSGLFLGNVPE
jgi:hypothetical protein